MHSSGRGLWCVGNVLPPALLSIGLSRKKVFAGNVQSETPSSSSSSSSIVVILKLNEVTTTATVAQASRWLGHTTLATVRVWSSVLASRWPDTNPAANSCIQRRHIAPQHWPALPCDCRRTKRNKPNSLAATYGSARRSGLVLARSALMPMMPDRRPKVEKSTRTANR